MQDNEYSFIRRIYEKIIAGMSAVGALWTFLLMVIIVIDVIGRTAFKQPLTGTSEIIRNSIVGITFLQLAHVLKVDRQIRTTIIMDRVSPFFRKGLHIFACLLGVMFTALLIYSEWTPTIDAFVNKDYEGEGALRVPTFPVHFLILLGSLFFLLQFLMSIFDTLFRPNDSQETDEEV